MSGDVFRQSAIPIAKWLRENRVDDDTAATVLYRQGFGNGVYAVLFFELIVAVATLAVSALVMSW